MTITETVCANCGNVTTDDDPTPFCPHCGDEDPWEEQAAYEFNSEDLPIVFSYEFYKDK